MDSATKVESNVQQAVPFLWVHDIKDSTRFYVDGLGFNLTKQWIDEGTLRWCWLELGGTAMMLQEFWKAGHNRNLPEAKVGLGVSIHFTCKDALAIYREVTSRGVQGKRPFVGNGCGSRRSPIRTATICSLKGPPTCRRRRSFRTMASQSLGRSRPIRSMAVASRPLLRRRDLVQLVGRSCQQRWWMASRSIQPSVMRQAAARDSTTIL